MSATGPRRSPRRRSPRRRGALASAAALLSVLTLSGCERGPSRAQIQNDLSTREPDCRVVQHLSGEGDADHVYLLLTLDCRNPPHLREAEAGYQRREGKWHMFHFARGSGSKH